MRPSVEETCLRIATVVAERGTCVRRKVGCVLVDGFGHILSTGYNGVARGQAHCSDTPCPGSKLPSGTGLDKCEAIHAEQNALLQCRDTQQIEACFTTVSPCLHCVKLLMNTGCKSIVFLEAYANMAESRNLWWSSRKDVVSTSHGRLMTTWVHWNIATQAVHPKQFGNISW